MGATSRTTINLRNDLIEKAREYSGIKSKTELLHASLETFIAIQAQRRLARMGGIDPTFKLPRRRRSA